jgi:hypothetical protein
MTTITSGEGREIVDSLFGHQPPYVGDLAAISAIKRPAARVEVASPHASRATDDLDPAAIPKTIGELTNAVTRAYDLSTTRAGELNIPIVGSVGGGLNRRVVVLERAAYKILIGTSGTEYHFGYALRLCLTVNKWDANMKISLPFLAASAQIGQVEASWMLNVAGLAGPKISAAIAPPAELNVETFVIAKQSLSSLIDAVNDASTIFVASQLLKIEPAAQRDANFRKGAAKTYALSRIARRASLADALKRIRSTDAAVNDSISDTYFILVGGAQTDPPSEDAARKARDLLIGVEADV